MSFSDTSPAAKKLQMEIELAMTGEERIVQALEASLLVREFAKSKIRSDHPDWTEAQIAREVLRFAFLPSKLPAGLR
jgi:hypothetical protein